jgi:HEPN domain-containing protein
MTCFHCQQPAEKVLKAFLVWKAARFEKVHSLTYLLDFCEGQDPDMGTLLLERQECYGLSLLCRRPR